MGGWGSCLKRLISSDAVSGISMKGSRERALETMLSSPLIYLRVAPYSSKVIGWQRTRLEVNLVEGWIRFL